MQKVFDAIKKEIGFVFPNYCVFNKIDNGLKIECKKDFLRIDYSSNSQLMRAGLIVKANGLNCDYIIEEKSQFDNLCFMVDCSRNSVKSIESVKKLIRNLAMLGYNSLMLYTEDVYEVKNEPLFGYLRGRYTIGEMKELDAYALSLGIELIPCIQTLAHLNQLSRYSNRYVPFDCSDILLVGHERTYQLIENIFITLKECFSTNRVHIGMDEAGMLGRGRYLTRNGHKSTVSILKEHLDKVCAIAEKYGLEPIIWSDMFRNEFNSDKYKNQAGKIEIPKDVVDSIPKNLSLCYWDYHGLTEEYFYDGLEMHKQYKNPVWFAGGTAMANRGILPHLQYSFKIAENAINAGKKFGVKNLIETMWGDNGGECSVFAVLPALAHYSYTAIGCSKDRLYNEFYALTGHSFDDFITLDYPQTFCGKFTDDIANPAKYGLYNDVFSGYLDPILNADDKNFFKLACEKLKKNSDGQYQYLFKTAFALSDFLYYKYSLGIELRKAYKEKNKAELWICYKNLCVAIKKLKLLIKFYREQWLKENKPHGFEVQEIRLGGLLERLKGCKIRLKDYLHGKINGIDELEEQLLAEVVGRVKQNNRCDEYSYMSIASVNSFDGYTYIDV